MKVSDQDFRTKWILWFFSTRDSTPMFSWRLCDKILVSFTPSCTLQRVASLSGQLDWFRKHLKTLRAWTGEVWANHIIGDAVYVISTGSNDYSNNYLLDPSQHDNVDEDTFVELIYNEMVSFVHVHIPRPFNFIWRLK